MERKKLFVQVFAAILLYVGISLILEKEHTQEIVMRELTEGLVFGFIYGVFIWLSARWRKKK